MTSKNAVARLPLGGGKAVLAVPEMPQGRPRRELMLRYGGPGRVAPRQLRDGVRHEHRDRRTWT